MSVHSQFSKNKLKHKGQGPVAQAPRLRDGRLNGSPCPSLLAQFWKVDGLPGPKHQALGLGWTKDALREYVGGRSSF